MKIVESMELPKGALEGRNARYREAIRQSIFADDILPEGAARGHGEIALANSADFTESNFNQPLTSFAMGWKDPNDIEATLEFIAPGVQTPRWFTYGELINAEEFFSDTDDARAIGSEFKRVEYRRVRTIGKTENKGLTIRIDLDEIPSEQQNPVGTGQTTQWERIQTGKLLRRCLRNELRRAIALASAAATNTAKTWDATAGKDPDQDLRTDLVAANTASGLRPNRVLFGDTAWDKRNISHRAQNTAGGFASAMQTEAAVAGILGVDGVKVSRERYQSATATKSEIVNNLVIEAYAGVDMDPEDASNLKRFWTPVLGGGRWRVYTQQMSAKLYDITVEYYSLIKVTSTLGLRKLTIS